MNCMRCGAVLTESAYCPKCGCDVVVQKQAIVLSGLYYNQGLEKAGIRDLSGAIDQLKRSLKFNKLNVSSRNLLGLVYFETGEVVAALSEWVISKNIMPENNVASEYIDQLQSDPNKLDTINQTIKKYNQALTECREGNEDIAMIQLKKVLAQNPKLIKGYHLLALLHMRGEEYEKARRVLKKAARIDKTNTTTLRFLREVDEQTGTPTTLDGPRWGNREKDTEEKEQQMVYTVDNDVVVQPPTFRESSVVATLLNLGFGLLVGAAMVYFLFIPSRTLSINRGANKRVSEYSRIVATQSTQLEQKDSEIETSKDTVQNAENKVNEAKSQVTSYEYLMKANSALQAQDYTTAAAAIQKVDSAKLSVDGKAVYDTIVAKAQETLFTRLYEEGTKSLSDGDFAAAATALAQAVQYKADDYDALNNLAAAYRLGGDNANAIASYQKIVTMYPGTTRAIEAQSYIDQLGGAAAGTDAAAGTATGTEGTTNGTAADGTAAGDGAAAGDAAEGDGTAAGTVGTDTGTTEAGEGGIQYNDDGTRKVAGQPADTTAEDTTADEAAAEEAAADTEQQSYSEIEYQQDAADGEDGSTYYGEDNYGGDYE